MTVASEAAGLSSASDYLGLTAAQRYDTVSQHFPEWLLTEPIQFPRHDPTYGWACLVDRCDAGLRPTDTRLLCSEHGKEFASLQGTVALGDFVRTAAPSSAHRLGWALKRKPGCTVCGPNREAQQHSCCTRHSEMLRAAQRAGADDEQWLQEQKVLSPLPQCSVPACVHDGELRGFFDDGEHRMCRAHRRQLTAWRPPAGETVRHSWTGFLSETAVRDSVSPPAIRGMLTLRNLPVSVQQEVRYGLHRHQGTARRTHWRPTDLQAVIDALVSARVTSLDDPSVSELSRTFPRGSVKRRILLDLPFATRSLAVNDAIAKAAGWFDPIIVGSKPFPGTQGSENRRKIWDLTMVSQSWLRDLLWDHLRDAALQPDGKQPSSGTIYNRITGIILLSCILRQNRSDHGQNPQLIGGSDARAVKDIWDLWYRERIPIPRLSGDSNKDKPSVLTERSRHIYMSSIRIVLTHGQRQQTVPSAMDSFILGLPEYPRPAHNPRPRPLTYENFRQLVSEENLATLDAVDHESIGLVDIWLTQAFQGGRVSETLKLRLGCVGLVGRAQPYIWRDITKIGVVDYGMPCHTPVYERLLRRKEITLVRLRARYSDRLAGLDDHGRSRQETAWEREMPLFPSATQNPDLVLEVSQSHFRDVWADWLQKLGLSGITTHQTRATLATSLLNNGAPPELVRQLLGHFSHEALAHYANYSNDVVARELQKVWVAGPGVDKPGRIILHPNEINTESDKAVSARIDLAVVPVEHGLCRYGPVVGGAGCPFSKNCTDGPLGPCEHFVLTGADLSYWERKRDAAYHFAEGAPTAAARDYILSQWHPWEPVLAGLREALNELGLLEAAEDLDLRTPVHDYFDPLFATGFPAAIAQPLNTPPSVVKDTK